MQIPLLSLIPPFSPLYVTSKDLQEAMKKCFITAAKVIFFVLSYIKRTATHFFDFLQKKYFTPPKLKRPVTRLKEVPKKPPQNSYAFLDQYYLTSIPMFDTKFNKADEFVLSAAQTALSNVKFANNSPNLTRQKELLTLIEDQGASEGENIFLWFPSVAIVHFFLLEKYGHCPYELDSVPEILLPTENLQLSKQKLEGLLKEFLAFDKEKQSLMACEVFSFYSPEDSSNSTFIKKIYEYANALERDPKFQKALTINYQKNSWKDIIN